ncbi:hypothetical protein SAMN05216275_101279 [Streptosporangium canum]|uniref:Uncharacterized protein n=1 Tax=Streptosporangium canum TaxID=324952 RepID=A0A1I3FNV0_9ACTN|nr:hypothetical protein [Streptosporangium canum]SFI12925.1 hypothetical protein SAMN05216275_101279 [Streptosporangium canum]
MRRLTARHRFARITAATAVSALTLLTTGTALGDTGPARADDVDVTVRNEILPDKCLSADPATLGNPATEIHLLECSGGAGQKWSLSD